VLGNVLPALLMNALCLAIYGMFVAIVAPVARKEMPVLAVVVIAAALHGVFHYVPALSGISSGLTVSICAIAAALLGALLFPVRDEEGAE
jgi:predicted branched-subunit amino acid permease